MSFVVFECVLICYIDDGLVVGMFGSYDDECVMVMWLLCVVLGIVEVGSMYCGGVYLVNYYDLVMFDLLCGVYFDWNCVIDVVVLVDDCELVMSVVMVKFIVWLCDEVVLGN